MNTIQKQTMGLRETKHRTRRQKPEEYPQVKNDRSLKQYMKAALRGPAGNL